MKKKRSGEDAYTTRLGDLISKKLAEKDLEILDLAKELEVSYEHARRIVKGLGVPSKPILRIICTYLGMNYKEAEKMVTVDKIQKKYGGIPLELSNKKPGLEPIERVWDSLTPSQQRDAVTLIQGWARRGAGA